jgi:hypothetical protein
MVFKFINLLMRVTEVPVESETRTEYRSEVLTIE